MKKELLPIEIIEFEPVSRRLIDHSKKRWLLYAENKLPEFFDAFNVMVPADRIFRRKHE